MTAVTPQTKFASTLAVLLLLAAAPLSPERNALVKVSGDDFLRAVNLGRASLIDLFLREHVDPNALGPWGRTPLLIAALQQDWETAHRLIEAGAPVDLADQNGFTPLMASAMSGKIDILRAILQRLPHVDALDRGGHSALYHALAAKQTDAAEALLAVMSNDAIIAAGGDLLALALETGDQKIVRSILQRLPPLPEWSARARRALETAIADGRKDEVRLLLAKHAVPPTPEGKQVPLLAYAVVSNNAQLFSTFLDCGADPNTTLPAKCDKDFLSMLPPKSIRNYLDDDNGVTMLMLAAGTGQTEYLRALLKAGADRNRATKRCKMLALYLAAETGHWRCTQILLGSEPAPEKVRIEISLASQKVALIKDGVPILNSVCSTGRDGFSTHTGDYVITDKERSHRSTIYKVEMPYFMRLSCLDFGMHEGVVPNYPASHGCIRLPGDVARRFFDELPVGTLVTVK